ncbi:class I SAM-dependent methyltransferase [Acinetobacter celticus]|uniref:Methyltransferase type 11 n=1 Tax=Acinetobacter celticus TaxID=1891224 RepID=A0A1C3CTW3_9GAMM|nr:class I SAM-dependent methyltransferase [Acinetobacter celticus]ODA12137.1 methyltransferase type 11 [Acinetobacter celticus]
MQKQVEHSHYKFSSYVHKQRWISIWHQLDEVIKLNPQNVLEIGPGPGLFKAAAGAFCIDVETLDIDTELKPDHVASVLALPFDDNSFDVVCAFQMLEHLPFVDSLLAFSEMARVARKAVIISLPDAAKRWPISIDIPMFGIVNFLLPRPRLRALNHIFDGEHYWEVNKAGYLLKEIENEFCKSAPVILNRTFRVPENPYHRFFIFSKNI